MQVNNTNQVLEVETPEQEIARLRAENTILKRAQSDGSSIKLGMNKDTQTFTGTVCLYGLGRFPIALYPSQWEKVFAQVDNLKAFIEANREELAKHQKPAKQAVKVA